MRVIAVAELLEIKWFAPRHQGRTHGTSEICHTNTGQAVQRSVAVIPVGEGEGVLPASVGEVLFSSVMLSPWVDS